MGWPVKPSGAAAPIITHHSVTFSGISDASEATALITETPMDRSVILLAGYTGRIWEDGSGTDQVEGIALRQINDTNVGLWVTNETGNAQNVTVNFTTLTFSQNVIKSLVHYDQTFDPPNTDEDWQESNLTLTTPVDAAKAAVFSGIMGAGFVPQPSNSGDTVRAAQLYMAPPDGANAKIRYQTDPGNHDPLRLFFSVLEFN